MADHDQKVPEDKTIAEDNLDKEAEVSVLLDEQAHVPDIEDEEARDRKEAQAEAAELNVDGIPEVNNKRPWYEWALPFMRQDSEYQSLENIGIVPGAESPTESLELEPVVAGPSNSMDEDALILESILRKRNSIDILSGTTNGAGRPAKRARFNSAELAETFVYETNEDYAEFEPPQRSRLDVFRDHARRLPTRCVSVLRKCSGWFFVILVLIILLIWLFYSWFRE